MNKTLATRYFDSGEGHCFNAHLKIQSLIKATPIECSNMFQDISGQTVSIPSCWKREKLVNKCHSLMVFH